MEQVFTIPGGDEPSDGRMSCRYAFAPTEVSAKNLRDEGKKEENIYITGNTAIDAMATTVDENYENPIFDWIGDDRMILLTAHRRENLGEPMYHIFRAIKRIVDEFADVKLYIRSI